MGAILHRPDITYSDARKLANFCYALNKLTDRDGKQFMWDIDSYDMCVPLWVIGSDKKLSISGFKIITTKAYGLERAAFMRICKYLKLYEHELVALLVKFSMLSVVPVDEHGLRLQYRQWFYGRPHDEFWHPLPEHRHGYVIERRRADGDFRRKNQDCLK